MNAFQLLDKWFTSHNPLDWGSKSLIVNRLASQLNITKKKAAELHNEWVASK